MEYFDVLTETGEYEGRIESRDICHEKGLWHKAVAMFMINSNDEVLLQKRSASKKLFDFITHEIRTRNIKKIAEV